MTDTLPARRIETDDDFATIGTLNHLLFCPRRCALARNEGLWCENVYTVEGSHAHRRVHTEGAESEAGFRTSRGVWLRSTRLRLVGVADLVEFRPAPYPIEYKRGRKRRWDNDEVQLCAQALCLEEMLGQPVRAGAIFHVRSRRRREVVFDAELRRTTEEAVERLHALLASNVTPPPVLQPKCRSCSLRPLCLPELLSQPDAGRRALEQLFVVDP
jgi:CRISPR-associated exonuclease Cas4